ncbi:hypothetical protein ACO1O0_007246 [Amphichorda felina]
MKEYDAKQVAQHKSPDDAWLTIHGKVYDVTKYLADHPGGAEVLMETAGTDASEDFDSAGHSEDAFELMEAYLVGQLKGFVDKPKKQRLRPIGAATPTPQQPARSSSNKTESSAGKLVNVGLLSIAAAAVVFYVGQGQGVRLTLPKLPGGHLAVREWVLSLLDKKPSLVRPHSSGLGFTSGLLVGCSVFASATVVLVRRFAKLILVSKSFTSYPPHVKVPKRIQDDSLLQSGHLDPVKYVPIPLQTKTLVAPNVYRLTFNLPTPSTVLGLPIGQHVAIKANVAGESVSRSYTPVSNNSDRGILELLIKVYPDGKLTNGYLAKLNLGDEVLFRGPKGAMRYHPDLCRKIGMVAGGTGITPMFQLIRAICEDSRDTTEVSLIYANRTEEDILLRSELDRFARQYPKNFKVYYLLDKPPAKWEFGSGYVTAGLMAERLPGPGSDSKVMLCGPPGMVNAAKKSLVSLGFEKPGASAKITDQVFVF